MVFNFVDLRSRILSLDGAVSTKNCESDFCQLVIAHERSAKVGLCKTAPAKNGSILLYLRYEQATSNKQNMAPATLQVYSYMVNIVDNSN